MTNVAFSLTRMITVCGYQAAIEPGDGCQLSKGRRELLDVAQEVNKAVGNALAPETLPTAMGKPMPSGARANPPSVRPQGPAATAN